jgi:hypothetical protein
LVTASKVLPTAEVKAALIPLFGRAAAAGILVPDRALEDWKSSDPRGFATWFKQRGRAIRMDKRASVEPLPAMQSVDEKTPLQRVVQLLKRARDRFVTDLDLSPRSIVLTTLAGEGYTGFASTAGTMSEVLQHLRDLVSATAGPLKVYNPANRDELLSEQWVSNPAAYREFKRWLAWFTDEWGIGSRVTSGFTAGGANVARRGAGCGTDPGPARGDHGTDAGKRTSARVELPAIGPSTVVPRSGG